MLVVVTLLALVVWLVGCGSLTTQHTAAGSTPTVAPWPTSTPKPTTPPVPYGVACSDLLQGAVIAAHSGDLTYTKIQASPFSQHRQLPSTLPLAPMSVQLVMQHPDLAQAPAVNVDSFVFSVCNSSTTKSHVLRRISLKLSGAEQATDVINVADPCWTVYSRANGLTQAGCGGGIQAVAISGAFATDATVGTVVQTTDADVNAAGAAWEPVTLAPGYGVTFLIKLKAPLAPATYTYALGVGVDGAAISYPDGYSVRMLTTATPRIWNGDACLGPAMQALIPPAATPPITYICPVK